MSDLNHTGGRTLSAAAAWPLAPAQLAGILSPGGLPSREAASRSSLMACMVPAQPANTCSMGGKETWIHQGPAAGIAARAAGVVLPRFNVGTVPPRLEGQARRIQVVPLLTGTPERNQLQGNSRGGKHRLCSIKFAAPKVEKNQSA